MGAGSSLMAAPLFQVILNLDTNSYRIRNIETGACFEVDLSDYAGLPEVKVRFRTTRGAFGGADPAIDNISLLEVIGSDGLPFSDSFEFGLGEWMQVQDDDIDWSLNSGETATGGTGPSEASDGDFYIYFEGHDSGVNNKNASVERLFDLSGTTHPELTFDYHMHGPYVELLAVDIHDGTSWTPNVWSINGAQQTASTDPWLNVVVNLAAYANLPNVTIRFRAQQGFWHAADTAIDNVTVAESNTPPSPYELWTSTIFAGAPVGTDTSPSGNPDGDDYTNLEEWVLVLNPLVQDSPALTVTSVGNDFVLEYNRRDVDSPSVRAAWSDTLESNSWRYNGDGLTETLLQTNGDIQSMSASIPIDDSKKFVRLEVWFAEDEEKEKNQPVSSTPLNLGERDQAP